MLLAGADMSHEYRDEAHTVIFDSTLFPSCTPVPFFAPRRGTPTAIPKSAEQRRELRAPAYFNIFVIHISQSPARKLSDIFCRDGRKSNYFIVTIFYRNEQNVARLFARHAFIDLNEFQNIVNFISLTYFTAYII